MPELPEVETTRLGILPHLLKQQVIDVSVLNPNLRWRVPESISEMIGTTIQGVNRRAKYLFLSTEKGTLMLHLGMSGSLRICSPDDKIRKHDHLIIDFKKGIQLRLHDPRRFGAAIWEKKDPNRHALIHHLGPEPLEEDFHTEYLFQTCRGRQTTIKQHIMNAKIVVGVGNIYASESLYRSGIHPLRKAGKISKKRIAFLTDEIRTVLSEAIAQGGTTLRDFLNHEGNPGYFKQRLFVYDRENQPCRACQTPIKRITISNRSTFYCPRCQS